MIKISQEKTMPINQSAVIAALRTYYKDMSDLKNDILDAPGICNGLVHLYHRYCIKLINQNNGAFTLEYAKKAANKVSLVCQNIVEGQISSKRLHQLCYFQSPNMKQPEGSFCSPSRVTMPIDLIGQINHNYNCSKHLSRGTDTSRQGDQILPYLKQYDGMIQKQRFAATLSPKALGKVLLHYLPHHKDELIRIASPTHVTAMSYHEDGADSIITIFDPNYPINKNLKILKMDNFNESLKDLLNEIGSCFYNMEGFYFYYGALNNKNLCLSFKFYSMKSSQTQVSLSQEYTSVEMLKKLLEENILSPDETDSNNYDSLFICAQYGHENEVRYLLHRYPNINESRINGNEYKSTPIKTSRAHGHHHINSLLSTHRITRSL